ncbi:glycoside hydrolase family 5 protein [Sphingomonas ginkgonis]|uniref:Glycoside hydrolase family 5 protein n=2 Tax=Sphingomonas ginkgonis TaxID=2315330 RepID=A0A429VE49_9SPHN|nr:glycoside hydrolase family 5 protein [Sphingomonas ginkgonis]
MTLLASVAATPAAAAAPDSGFHRGMNVLGYDPGWKDPAKARFQTRHFAEIRRAGFDFVRVNLFGFRALDARNRLDPKWLARVDWIVREGRRAGLGVILDEHDYDTCSDDPEACRSKLLAVWQQLGARYARADRKVAFELLNEPHGKIDAAAWNAFFPPVLAEVRKRNPDRWVVIGPSSWNSLAQLPNLVLPEDDRRLLVTFHYYEPFRFTHQGAGWVKEFTNVHGVTWGSAQDRAALAADFGKVEQWAAQYDRPILLGEFGAYDKSGTPVDQRAAYTAAAAREAERRGFAWSYWQFDSDFVAWDMNRNAWVEPIRRALIPAG